MKNKTCFLLLIFITLPVSPIESQSSWESLASSLRGMSISFLNGPGSTGNYIPCPSTLPHKNLAEFQEYFFITSAFRHALEKSGLKEPVTIELHQNTRSLTEFDILFVKLGTFSLGKIGEEHHSVQVSRQMLRLLILDKVNRNISLTAEEPARLVFKDAANTIKAEIEVTYQFPFDYEKLEYGQLDQYIIKDEIKEAEKFCLKQKGSLRRECLHILCDALFKEQIMKWITDGNYEAIEDHCQKKTGEFRGQCYRIAAEIFQERNDYERAIRYFEKTGFKASSGKIGEIYFRIGDYQKAAEYFDKGIHSPQRAEAYAALAGQYLNRGEKENAKEYYNRALAEYEFLLKDNGYTWNKKDNDNRILCLKILGTFEKTPEEIVRSRKLNLILEKTAAYCGRLDNEMIHFFCNEVIREAFERDDGVFENSLVYEYQLIKEKTGITERRILLNRNGEKVHIEDVPLGTLKYKYEYLIYGPIAFFKKSSRDRFDYKLVGEETLKGRKVVVVEALPLKMGDWKPLCGKIWLDADDYSILKIKWHPKFLIENFHESLESARRLNTDLVVDYYSEFGIEKDGIRYPSRYWVKEYRVDRKGKKKSTASLDAAFRKYRFFSVGTEVTYEE